MWALPFVSHHTPPNIHTHTPPNIHTHTYIHIHNRLTNGLEAVANEAQGNSATLFLHIGAVWCTRLLKAHVLVIHYDMVSIMEELHYTPHDRAHSQCVIFPWKLKQVACTDVCVHGEHPSCKLTLALEELQAWDSSMTVFIDWQKMMMIIIIIHLTIHTLGITFLQNIRNKEAPQAARLPKHSPWVLDHSALRKKVSPSSNVHRHIRLSSMQSLCDDCVWTRSNLSLSIAVRD